MVANMVTNMDHIAEPIWAYWLPAERPCGKAASLPNMGIIWSILNFNMGILWPYEPCSTFIWAYYAHIKFQYGHNMDIICPY